MEKNFRSIEEINLQPLPGSKRWNSARPWEDESIYFILIDRFHDNHRREPVHMEGGRRGFGSREELHRTCGGTLTGIRKHLGYIKNLGCTSIWLSPVLENNPHSYHGYAIQNFLNIDPRFGRLQDLKELIEEAHRLDLRVILDVVLNHSGDNWYYLGKSDPSYSNGQRYRFGGWRNADYPLPLELRNQEYYQRKGCIRRWDDYPETCEGDFFSLKKFNHEESEAGVSLQEILIKAYCYLLLETDCDGFRLDAVKHLGPIPAARFSTRMKEYAKLIGKDPFFIFGEAPADDRVVAKFLEPVYSPKENKIYKGLDSLLDFPTHYILPKVVEGTAPVLLLKERCLSLERILLNKPGALPLITFLDNHDQIEKPYKKRIGARLKENQLLGALGLLICLPGIPCIYYGTEQGLNGEGDSDIFIREAMFSLRENHLNVLDQENLIYQEISILLGLRTKLPELRFGQLVFPTLLQTKLVSDQKDPEVVVFCRSLPDQNCIVAYNPSINETKSVYVKIDSPAEEVSKLYGRGASWSFEFRKGAEKAFELRMELQPMGFLILK